MSSRSGAALARAGPVFSALGDETRLAVVARLSAGGPQSIARLTAGSGVTRQDITKHLTVLAGAGLFMVREGRNAHDEVRDTLDLVVLAAGMDELDEQPPITHGANC